MGFFVDFAKQRIKDNKNLLAIFLGGTGSGKTYASLRYAELIDKKFSVDRVVFTTEEFMNVLNSGLKSGSVVVYDEIGVGHNARQWHSMANQMFNYILQTFRHRNIIVLFSTPDLSFLDKAARKLIHLTFTTVNINKDDKLCELKPLLTQNNPTYDKIYRKYPVILSMGKQQTINRVKFGLPSAELVEAYEAKKSAYTKELNESIVKQIESSRAKKEKKEFDVNEYKDKVIVDKDKFVKEYKGRTFVDTNMLRALYGLSYGNAKALKAVLDEELGYV